MLSIITKEKENNVKCSITGEPTFNETTAALRSIVKVFRISIPNAPEAHIAALLGSIVADALTSEEAAENE